MRAPRYEALILKVAAVLDERAVSQPTVKNGHRLFAVSTRVIPA